MKVVIATCAILLLVGCGPMQRKQAQTEMQGAVAECEQLYSDPALDPIRGKVALRTPTDQTFSMLADTSKPTEVERQAIAIWAQKRDECFARRLSVEGKYLNPSLVAVDRKLMSDSQSLAADLYNGLSTYGEFAKKRQELSNAGAANRAMSLAFRSFRSSGQIYKQSEQNAIVQQQLNRGVTCTNFGNMTTCR